MIGWSVTVLLVVIVSAVAVMSPGIVARAAAGAADRSDRLEAFASAFSVDAPTLRAIRALIDELLAGEQS
jgi:hypothetical protein